MSAARRVLAAIGLAVVGLVLAAAPAGATTIYTHPFIKSFDATGSQSSSGSTAPFGNVDHVALDQSTGAVYVLDTGLGVVTKFDADGNPWAFSALAPGVNSVPVAGLGGAADIAVDNSGTSTQGQIYAFGEGQPAHVFSPTGTELGGNFPLQPPGGTCGAAVDPLGNFWWGWYGGGVVGYNSAGFPLGGESTLVPGAPVCNLAINSAQPPSPTSGYFYIAGYAGFELQVYDSNHDFKHSFDIGNTLGWTVDPGNGNILAHNFDRINEWAPSTTGTPGPKISTFGGPDPAHGFPEGIGPCGPRGIAVRGSTHRVYVGDCGKIDIFGPGEPLIIPTVTATEPDTSPTTAILRGTASTDNGGPTTDCYFEWGINESYGNTVPCASPAGPIQDADGVVPVASPELTFLTPGQVYHYRLLVSNANGVSPSADRSFKPQGPPVIAGVFASEVNTDQARLTATVDPSGGDTRYRFEWGTTAAYGNSIPLPDFKLVETGIPTTVSQVLLGLAPGQTYHYQLVASNPMGTVDSGDHEFTTYETDVIDDKCQNAHVRRQTMTTLLLDCRAYELVSAADAGGYDVQSDLIPGYVVLPAQPGAHDRLLYSLHNGKVPGAAGATNYGLDPYVATRGSNGWTTSYVGVPADGTPATEPFGSPLSAADSGLSTFAFGGANICSPCFADGKVGIPVHRPDGSLVQGMAGALDPGPSATSAGYVGKSLSADGSHLVFGSTSKFEPDGNSNGDVTIYDRDLGAGITNVVSKTPGGATMTGPGIGQLDISADGTRILIGQQVDDDAAGNRYWHLYMNLGASEQTIDVTPGVGSAGVLFNGMTAGGSTVFITTTAALPTSSGAQDTDTSADIYEVVVVPNGGVSIFLVSTGPGVVGDACDPDPTFYGAHWNAVGATADCGAVAFAGGAGVAAGDETVYFLSPEKLDGSGTLNAPNLFVKRAGSPAQRVATVEPDSLAIRSAVRDSEVRTYADIQVTPSGDHAVFSSDLSLTGFPNFGHSEIYRYDADSKGLDCVSCAPSSAAATGDAVLSTYGLNIADDGSVFFTTPDQLVLRDSNKKKDAYQWQNGVQQLISTGNGAYDSSLVTVSSDGVNAYFYTRQVLVPEDENGAALKVYVARADGGFPFDPPPLPCQASDECHGPGSVAAPAPDIGTFKGTGGNLEPQKQKKKKKHRRKKPRRKGGKHNSKKAGERQGGRRHG
jgi:hypothetical protein